MTIINNSAVLHAINIVAKENFIDSTEGAGKVWHNNMLLTFEINKPKLFSEVKPNIINLLTEFRIKNGDDIIKSAFNN